MRRRGFVASLLAAPAALLTLPKKALPFTITKPKRIAFGYLDSATIEHHNLAVALGMPTLLVTNARYEWASLEAPPNYRGDVLIGPWDERYIPSYNYLQIVRTPIGWAGRGPTTDKDWESEKQWALRRHVRSIQHALQVGQRHKVKSDTTGDLTYTGGREFFHTIETGRCAYMRNRGLVWRQWGEGDSMRGEWLSDIGWAP